VVFTKTVALIIVVSITAETKSTKCNPNKTPKKRTCTKFLFNKPNPKGLLKKKIVAAKTKKAITKRQKAMEKISTSSRSLISTAAVPKNVPAKTPSKSALFLLNDNSLANFQTSREAIMPFLSLLV